MNIQDIINNIAEGDNLAAKEGLEHVLSAKAFDALQGYKQEIAATLYGGQEQEQEPEEDTDHEEDEEEVAYAEGVEHNDEQLEERAKWRTSSIAHNTGYRKDGAHGGIENTADTGKEDMLKNRGRGIRSGTPLTKSDTKSLKKSITKNMSQMKK
jgi:hypothetical protein